MESGLILRKDVTKMSSQPTNDLSSLEPKKVLTPEAQRALAEAAERRKLAEEAHAKEEAGPKGPEPTRYGDWERNGLAVDF
jgi:hypothetical protein